MNPWLVENSLENIECSFEDNFIVSENNKQRSEFVPLADSAEYINGLEKKLKKLRTNATILEQLKKKREDCFHQLLNDTSLSIDVDNLDLNSSIQSNLNSELYRYFQPEQPINTTETLHIIEYDQLDKAT